MQELCPWGDGIGYRRVPAKSSARSQRSRRTGGQRRPGL